MVRVSIRSRRDHFTAEVKMWSVPRVGDRIYIRYETPEHFEDTFFLVEQVIQYAVDIRSTDHDYLKDERATVYGRVLA